MFKKLLLSICLLGTLTFAYAQDVEALKAEKAEKEGQISSLQGEVDAIQAQLDAMPGWRLGAFGTIGLNFSYFDSWLGRDKPNTSASNIGFTYNAFANLIQEKYFWRNSGNLNMAWIKFDDRDVDTDEDGYEIAADVFNISSLYGQRLNDKVAISVLGEYRSTILSNFNNPGYLDIGAGATWTPTNNLVVVFHPLNYNFVFAKDDVSYESSLGCKIVADYTQKLFDKVNWKSNLSTFISYSDPSNYSNWTWINGLSFAAWKGIGVGFELGLRGNKQEAYNDFLSILDVDGNPVNTADNFSIDDLNDDNNPLQVYWLLGFTYSL